LLNTEISKAWPGSRSGGGSFRDTIWNCSGEYRAGTRDAIRLPRSTWPRASGPTSRAHRDEDQEDAARTYSAATGCDWAIFSCHFATSRQGASAGILLE